MLQPAFRRIFPRVGSSSGRTAPRPGRRSFATTVFNIPASGPSAPEQTLFVVGLNKGKFFGQDGAEECLKLLERVAEHNPEYHLLVGLNDKEMSVLEEEHKVKNNRLTPSRDLVLTENGEVVPIIQAGMVDKRPCQSLGRALKTTQGHVAWRLWRNPREAIKMYRLFWRRKEHKDAARFKFWSENLPLASHVYFGETAELIAIRTTEHLITQRNAGVASTTVLTVRNEVFASVAERCRHYIGEDEEGLKKLSDPEYSAELKQNAGYLCKDVPDMTPLLCLIYIGFPLLALHQVMLCCEGLYVTGSTESDGSDFGSVTGNRE